MSLPRIRRFWRKGNSKKIQDIEQKLAEISKFCEARMNFVNSNNKGIKGFYRHHLFEFAVQNLREGYSLFSEYKNCFIMGAYNPDYEALQVYCQRMVWVLYRSKIRIS